MDRRTTARSEVLVVFSRYFVRIDQSPNQVETIHRMEPSRDHGRYPIVTIATMSNSSEHSMPVSRRPSRIPTETVGLPPTPRFGVTYCHVGPRIPILGPIPADLADEDADVGPPRRSPFA